MAVSIPFGNGINANTARDASMLDDRVILLADATASGTGDRQAAALDTFFACLGQAVTRRRFQVRLRRRVGEGDLAQPDALATFAARRTPDIGLLFAGRSWAQPGSGTR